MNILFVAKSHHPAALRAAAAAARHVRRANPAHTVLLEDHLYSSLGPDYGSPFPLSSSHHSSLNLVVGLGGDGTALRISSLFSSSPRPHNIPPLLGLSLGRLGFLMPHSPKNFPAIFDAFVAGKTSLQLRSRLACQIDRHHHGGNTLNHTSLALNEVHISRGQSPHMAFIDTYINNQLLTQAVADGLIISSPTGATAYNLSAGGPLVHPSLPSMLLTPICPRSLSFRSIIVPPDSKFTLKVSSQSRSPLQVSVDGRSDLDPLQIGEQVHVSMSEYPMPCVVQSPSHHDEWVADVNTMLSFNTKFLHKNM